MARCEDFPCCGHEAGCCPDFDDAGRQLNMVCTCGAVLPVNERYSICDACLYSDMDDEDSFCDDSDGEFDEEFADEHDGQPDDFTENSDFEQADEYFGYYGDDN